MNYIRLTLFLGSIHLSAYASPLPYCTAQQFPQLIQPIDNWTIIAHNTIPIKTASHFSGSELTYTMTHQPIKAENKVTLDEMTGELTIDAAKKDNFNVSITARNACGTVTSTFNVQIDEEQ